MTALTTEDAAQFLYREARLLDERRFEEWLALFTADGLYWAPTDDTAENPYDKVSLIHDDALRREERVFRIAAAPPSQSPISRTLHIVSNVEIEDGADGEARVHSSQIVYEMRAGGGNYRYLELGEPRSFAIRCEHVLRPDSGAWRIALKKMLLLNRDIPIGNLTFIL